MLTVAAESGSGDEPLGRVRAGRRAVTRQLTEADRAAVERVFAAHPVASAQVAERIAVRGLGWRSDGRMFGYGERRSLEAVVWAGGQVTPLGADRSAISAFAEVLGYQPRSCASLVGPSDAVLSLWELLRPVWGPERTVRGNQPLLMLDRPPAKAIDPLVRLVRRDELDVLFPAAVAMYTEEVGVSPVGEDGGRGYKTRVEELIRAGRSYAKILEGRVIFKAELAVVTRHTVQLQGVWVDPAWRGRGVGTSCLATVVRDALRRFAPTVSLYVNDFNGSALRVYERLGFRTVGSFATVLF